MLRSRVVSTLWSLLTVRLARHGAVSSTFRSTSMVPSVAPGLTSGTTCRRAVRLSAASWSWARRKSGTCPVASAGTAARSRAGSWCLAPTTFTVPTRVWVTCSTTTPPLTCCSGRSTYTDW
jgi:hypothetical protein